MSIHPGAVALVFGLTYAIAGFVAFAVFAFTDLPIFVLPIGFIMGMFHLNVNLQLARSHDLLANAFLCLSAVICYGITGCITGAVVVSCFNFIARKMGGIDAKYVTLVGEDASPEAKNHNRL